MGSKTQKTTRRQRAASTQQEVEVGRHRQHALKTWPGFWVAVARGEKTFDYRRNDRDFQVGDTLLLEEWDPAYRESCNAVFGKEVRAGYTGRQLRARICHILQGQFGVPEGYAVLGLKDVEITKS